MFHTTLAMLSSAAISSFDWTALAAGLQSFAMHVMDATGGIWI